MLKMNNLLDFHLALNSSKAHHDHVYNYVDHPERSKHWFLQHMPKLNENGLKFTDFLQRRRLQTLFSVDDGIKEVNRKIFPN